MRHDSMSIWIDIINPSDAFFFAGLVDGLRDFDVQVTLRRRAETENLSTALGLHGKTVGRHYSNPALKPYGTLERIIRLATTKGDFDYGFSFENLQSVVVCRARGKKSFLFCDNDYKLTKRKGFLLSVDNMMRLNADRLFVPSSCAASFEKFVDAGRLDVYDGYKEDIYIAGYRPDPGFRSKLGAERYVVVRPEAMTSTYVSGEGSLVPRLLSILEKENYTVVYVPRDQGDIEYAKGHEVLIPDRTLNGLDLCFHADAVMTGSGTMAREAACLGTTAVSFFPGSSLLSVDQKLVDEGKMMHSRVPEDIVRHIQSTPSLRSGPPFERSVGVRRQLLGKISSRMSE